jgi:hypothetical protein
MHKDALTGFQNSFTFPLELEKATVSAQSARVITVALSMERTSLLKVKGSETAVNALSF